MTGRAALALACVWLGCAGLAIACAAAWCTPAFAQPRLPAPPATTQPLPAPERVYPGALDRPLSMPDSLSGEYIDLDKGVQIGLGPQIVFVESEALGLKDKRRPNGSDGVVISADVALGNIRLEYVRQFYRRDLPSSTTFKGQPVNFLSVDSDQLWLTGGWRPWLRLYLGAGVGLQRRLIRIREDGADRHTDTEIGTVGGILADLTLSPPFSLQLRIIREEGGKLLRMESAILEIAYMVPF